MFSHTMAVPSGRALNGAGASWRVSALAAAPKGNATAAARHADSSRRRRAGKDGTDKATPRSGRAVAAGKAAGRGGWRLAQVTTKTKASPWTPRSPCRSSEERRGGKEGVKTVKT